MTETAITEGILTMLVYKWFIFPSWERVHYTLTTNNRLEYRNQNIWGRIELSDVHSLHNAPHSCTMLELHVQKGKRHTYYFYFDTEREKETQCQLISDAILSSYAVGFGDVDTTKRVTRSIGQERWNRRGPFLMAMHKLRQLMLKRIARMGELQALLGNKEEDAELTMITRMGLEKELRYLQLLSPSAAYLAIFVGGERDFVRIIAVYL